MNTYESLKILIDRFKNDRKACWNIKLSNSFNKAGVDESTYYYAVPCKKFIATEIGITPSTLNAPEFKPLLDILQNILINYGIVLPGVNVSVLRIRQNAINWWGTLSDEDKIDLKVFGNRIQLTYYLSDWAIRGSSMRGAHVLTELHDHFCNELSILGGLDSDYISVKDREKLRDKNFISNQEKSSEKWRKLSVLPLNTSQDLLEPSNVQEDFIQLKQLFAIMCNTVSSKSGESNYQVAFGHFTRFLQDEGISPQSKLADILHEFILNRFKQDYIIVKIHEKKLSSNHATTIISSLRNTLKRAQKIKGLEFNSFHDVIFYKGARETISHKPFSKNEREAINLAISSDIETIKCLIKPYEISGVGEYPLDNEGALRQGMATVDNAQYLYENYLNCSPVFGHTASTKHEKAFIRIVNLNKTVKKKGLGLHELYLSWGILPVIDQHILAPFVFRLAQVTGMNVESIISLEINDLVMEHHATGKPCLRYWKERSTGQKELHLDLFQAKLQWLTQKQSKEVLDIFETVETLTKTIRGKAPEVISNLLFIYQSTGRNTMDEIMALNGTSKRIIPSYKRFVKKHSLKDDEGEATYFVITRFRPSFVSEMIEIGVSIREIQLMLGHKNIITTIGYLDKLDFNKVARDKVKNALENIHKKVISPLKKVRSKDYINNPERIIFTTPLGGCANIFNPPEFIKKSSIYIAGQPCSQYNKCLSCDNVMLMASHLPELFAMQRDYIILMQRNRIMDTPYGVIVEENLFLLDQILAFDKSEFSIEELEEGKCFSKFIETAVIDNVGG